MDWSSSYRLFSKERVDTSKLFDAVTLAALKETEQHDFIILHMDDTILKKTGKHIPGAAWRRDPLGPPFQTNLIWGQRFLQISMALPEQKIPGQSRAIPIDFYHCPTVKKPGKISTEQDWKNYNEVKKNVKLSKQGSNRIKCLREKMDRMGVENKQLVLNVDGSYTNEEMLKNLPERITLIGRIRKDTKLYEKPKSQSPKGRKKVYGDQLPTPEKIRQSEDYKWIKIQAWAAGKDHVFSVKIIDNVKWRSAGEKNDLKLIVIRPLGYRLTKMSKVLYRDPVYLICTETQISIQKILQSYLWRWEIEVNFREEKNLLGCGQAQVRNRHSAESVPAFIAATYSLIHLANYRTQKENVEQELPRAKWYKKDLSTRPTTGDIINNIRAQLWSKAIGINYSSFLKNEVITQSLRNEVNPCKSAMLYMRN